VITTKQMSWTDSIGNYKMHVVEPTSTKCKPVADASRELLAAFADYGAIYKELSAAQGDPARLSEQATIAAREAGRDGNPVDVKKLRKKVRDAMENLAEIELEWEASAARMRALRLGYDTVIQAHAQELAAEARQGAEAGIQSLAAAATMARRADAEMSAGLSILGALEAIETGAAFAPRPAKAARRREIGQGTAPSPYVGSGVAQLDTALSLASEILIDLSKAEKERTKAAAFDAAVEASPDLEDDDDEDDDDA
jgi:hypothetical protein